MNASFFQQINYSACNEDSEAELAALALNPASRVVVVTGSGSRTLDLLTETTEAVHSVDFSAAQNHLLRIKIAAYRTLDYDDMLKFLGVYCTADSLKLLNRVLATLDTDSRKFWQSRKQMVSRGLLYCGTWEKLLRWMARSGMLRRRRVRELLEADDVESQAKIWQRHWSSGFFRHYLRILSNRFLWKHIIREPGAKLIPADFDVATYLYDCMERMASRCLLRNNPFANLIFYGRYRAVGSLPLHLRREHYQSIKSNLERVKIHTASIADWLMSQETRFSAFSLSDFSSYATAAEYKRTWQAVVRTAKDGATFCERQFLVKRELPDISLSRDRSLEGRLRDIDQTCMYTFHAGRV